MKFLKNFFGSKPDDAPAWNVIPADQRPAPRSRVQPVEPEVKEKPEVNPFLNEAYGKFELEESTETHDDPYSSQSWEIDHESDSRKLRALQLGKKTERANPEDFNPYDTGVFKRGWK